MGLSLLWTVRGVYFFAVCYRIGLLISGLALEEMYAHDYNHRNISDKSILFLDTTNSVGERRAFLDRLGRADKNGTPDLLKASRHKGISLKITN